jgi:hypothetical protein
VRRLGYIIAAAVNAVMLCLINIWPGWERVSFLTEDTAELIWLVNVSIVVSIAVNLVYVVHDPQWLKSLGDLITTGVGLVVLTRIWRVFPFDFSGYSANWGFVARLLLVVAIAGSGIGLVVQTVTLIRCALTGTAGTSDRSGVLR